MKTLIAAALMLCVYWSAVGVVHSVTWDKNVSSPQAHKEVVQSDEYYKGDRVRRLMGIEKVVKGYKRNVEGIHFAEDAPQFRTPWPEHGDFGEE